MRDRRVSDLGVTKTHSRPNLSDDNRYSKSSSRQKHRMGFGAVPGAILLTDFAREDSGAHLLLGVVVVGAHVVGLGKWGVPFDDAVGV